MCASPAVIQSRLRAGNRAAICCRAGRRADIDAFAGQLDLLCRRSRDNAYVVGAAGIWNGSIVGVESSEENFDLALQQAAVTLLTLQFEDSWLDSEMKVLLDNANKSQALGTIPELMANSTLGGFNLIVPTAAHKMVRTYNDTLIAGYLDSKTGEEIHLPLFPDSQHWYLDGDQLVGRKTGRNPMNSTSLELLF